ncbi:MAG: hypothetical protein A3G28_06145 [Betaproteobacteria bacterium RIFCSPLOWO2_12_FULL_68_19]|nr:MAG: hypothetical protein A3G28_06145 [Betaproteobacteria bacterium RIFCSPLOWO2_12_FULL_68_19]
MNDERVLAMVLAGGEGTRLHPLTPGEHGHSRVESDRAGSRVTESGIVVIPIAPVRGDTNMYE